MRSRSGGWSSDSIQRALSRQRRTRPLTTMIVLIDNYDSFTYNLVQRLGELDPNIELQVFRNDKIDVDQVEKLKPSHIIISPLDRHRSDRKSTRLNSSHEWISYAVFCLKKKN